jgi:regulator of protease activity HflC (stomatin/prohibitin superfamily)
MRRNHLHIPPQLMWFVLVVIFLSILVVVSIQTNTLSVLAFIIVILFLASARIVGQDEEWVLQRLGRYQRKLRSGLNFMIPLIDRVAFKSNSRDQIINLSSLEVVTIDNVIIEIVVAVFWRILEPEKFYYGIWKNIEQALSNLVNSCLIYEIGTIRLERISTSRHQLNQALLGSLDMATEVWGVKVTRVEIQKISGRSGG